MPAPWDPWTDFSSNPTARCAVCGFWRGLGWVGKWLCVACFGWSAQRLGGP